MAAKISVAALLLYRVFLACYVGRQVKVRVPKASGPKKMGCQLLLLAEGCNKEVKLFRQEKKENKNQI